MLVRILRFILAWLGIIPRPDQLARISTNYPSGDELPPGRFILVQGGGADKWACFRCPGGCGERIDLPLVPNRSPRWRVHVDRLGRPSVEPSVRQLEGCRCHFWISKGQVRWCEDSGRSTNC